MYISEQLSAPDERRLRLSTQFGVTHLVVDNRKSQIPAVGAGCGPWDAGQLVGYREWIEGFGLRLDVFALGLGSVLSAAMTDLDLARQKRAVLIDNVRKAGDAGIGCLKYDTRLAQNGRTGLRPGRGGVRNVGFDYDEFRTGHVGYADSVPPVDEKAGWDAIEFLIEGLVPAAEAAGVRLACHPQDPAFSVGGPGAAEHVFGSVEGIRRFLALSPSRNHGLTFCQGSVAGMFKDPAKAMVPVIEEFAATGRIFLVKFRNIRGGYLDFQEVFPDEGDVDLFQAIKAYQRGGYAGPLCPDHVPVSELDEGGERFTAFCLGYTRGLLQAAGISAAAPRG